MCCHPSVCDLLSCFSFQHQMSLRRNATEFVERVRGAPISGNIDNPEGGLDALMQVKLNLRGKIKILRFLCQVIVCSDMIGWRKNARRVIVFTTDQVGDIFIILLIDFCLLRVSILLGMGSWEAWWLQMMGGAT